MNIAKMRTKAFPIVLESRPTNCVSASSYLALFLVQQQNIGLFKEKFLCQHLGSLPTKQIHPYPCQNHIYWARAASSILASAKNTPPDGILWSSPTSSMSINIRTVSQPFPYRPIDELQLWKLISRTEKYHARLVLQQGQSWSGQPAVTYLTILFICVFYQSRYS